MAILPACSRKTSSSKVQKQDPQQLFSYNWTLKEITGVKPFEGKAPTMDFMPEPPRVAGFAGCNSYSGAIMLTGADSLIFGAAAISEKLCMQQNPEKEFLAVMKNTSRYEITGQELKLYKDSELLAVLTGEDPHDNHNHEHEYVTVDGSWELENINGTGVTFEALYPNAKPFVNLDKATGKAGGSSSCNGFSSTFTLKGNMIRFGDAIATKMACQGNGEQAFFSALKQTDNYIIENDHLILKKGESVLMKFHRKH